MVSNEFNIVLDSAAAQSRLVGGIYVGNDPSSNGHFKLLNNWITNCTTLESHRRCRQSINSDISIDDRAGAVILPTRLIDVSSSVPVLEETKGQCGSYVTLSYLWGTEKDFVTTKSSLSQRL